MLLTEVVSKVRLPRLVAPLEDDAAARACVAKRIPLCVGSQPSVMHALLLLLLLSTAAASAATAAGAAADGAGAAASGAAAAAAAAAAATTRLRPR